MKTRQEIKAQAKAAMKQQWGLSIGAPLLWIVVVFVGGLLGMIPVLGILIIYGSLFFIDFPMLTHLCSIFVKIYNGEKAEVGELFSGFHVNWMRKAGGMAWVYLWTMLWTLLFIIPGIVKGIAYSMTPYILTDCPDVKATDAIKLSMRMTQGHKMDLFIMYLSFLGWYILGLFTLNILNIVFTMPYAYTTMSGYYVELKQKAIDSGTISADEFA